MPPVEELNSVAAAARIQDKRAHEARKLERAALPARRSTARQWWALAHMAIDGLITCTPEGKVTTNE